MPEITKPEDRTGDGPESAERRKAGDTLSITGKHRRLGLILLFCTLFISGAAVFHPVEYDNTASRYYLVSALVDFGAFNIDRYHKRTIDKSFFDGHYYSNKGVGAALLGVIPYWLIRKLAPDAERLPFSAALRYWVRLTTTTLPFALIGLLMFCLASRLGASQNKALAMVLSYGIGTPALIHATLFSGHVISGSCLFAAFGLVAWSVHQPVSKDLERWLFFCAGLLAGWAVLTDYPAVLLVGVLTLYVFASRWRRFSPWWFIAGGIPPALILLGTNWICFGSPFNLSYANQSFEEFGKDALVGLYGVDWPDLFSLGKLLISPARGILLVSPVLLLAGSGLHAMWRRDLRREALTIGGSIVLYLLFNSGYVQWHGGWMYGPRYLTPVLALSAFPIAFSRFRTFTWVCLLMISASQIWAAVLGMPHTPEEIVNPLPELILPLMSAGYIASNGGAVLGFQGLTSLPVVILIVLALGLGTWHCLYDSNIEGIGSGAVTERLLVLVPLAVVAGMLAFAHTPSRALIYTARARLLNDAAIAMKSVPLKQQAEVNRRLAVESARMLD